MIRLINKIKDYIEVNYYNKEECNNCNEVKLCKITFKALDSGNFIFYKSSLCKECSIIMNSSDITRNIKNE